VDHDALICRGLELHEARRYAAALPWFDRALRAAPGCPVAVYNRANALHMLGRDREAEPLLRELIAADPDELARRCPRAWPRSLQLDAHFLLFSVILYGRGFCAEAFRYAEEHLRRRRRGLYSVWSAREVRADVAALLREWWSDQPGPLARGGATRHHLRRQL
jgi:tetratricopeptide (TPR) repeat protein